MPTPLCIMHTQCSRVLSYFRSHLKHTDHFKADHTSIILSAEAAAGQAEGGSSVCVANCRAGSAQPVAYDTPYDDDGQSGSEGHHEQHQQGGEAAVVQHKGPGGLMGHMYNRKLEQAQQVGLRCIENMYSALGQTYMVTHMVLGVKACAAHLCPEVM